MEERMSVQVIVPAPLRKYTGNKGSVEADGQTVGQVIDDLEVRYPGIKSRIVEPDGRVKHFVNIFLNEEDIREKQGIATPVGSGDEVAIIPAIAGG
jgi:molybdopterin synthase sulfur carrier subunit